MTQRSKLRLISVISGVVLFVTSMLAVLVTAYAPGEIAIIRFIYELGDWLWVPMIIITQLGSPWIIFGLVIGMMYVHQYRAALRLLVAGGLTYLIVMVLKLTIMRPRPFLTLSDVLSRELSISGNGFPSGHSAMAAFVGFSLWFKIGARYRVCIAVGILLVGVSRIYLGVHSPLDVLGGFSAGILMAALQQLVPSVLKNIRTS